MNTKKYPQKSWMCVSKKGYVEVPVGPVAAQCNRGGMWCSPQSLLEEFVLNVEV